MNEVRHEWHIYSALTITCALVFIVIHISTGTPQILGAALAPVVGGAFALSDNWKNMRPIVHKYVIAIAIFSVFVTIFAFKLLKAK